MKDLHHPHGLVVPSYVFLAFRVAAAIRIGLAPVYAAAGAMQVVGGTLECLAWTLWVGIWEAMQVVGMRAILEGRMLGDDRVSGRAGRGALLAEDAAEKEVAERARLMEEGKGIRQEGVC